MKVNVIIQIKYVTDIPDDPECYEGANTRKKRIAKEKEYLKACGSGAPQGGLQPGLDHPFGQGRAGRTGR